MACSATSEDEDDEEEEEDEEAEEEEELPFQNLSGSSCLLTASTAPLADAMSWLQQPAAAANKKEEVRQASAGVAELHHAGGRKNPKGCPTNVAAIVRANAGSPKRPFSSQLKSDQPSGRWWSKMHPRGLPIATDCLQDRKIVK